MLGILLAILETTEEKEWFTRFYEYYIKDLYHIALYKLKNTVDAEDAVQNAFLAAARNGSKIIGVYPVEHPKLKAYIITVLESKIIDTFRYRKRHEADNYDTLQVEALQGNKDNQYLCEIMKRLSPRARHVLLLRYDMGFSPKEIAQQLNVSIWTVYKLIDKAKSTLKSLLEAEDEQ